MCVCPKECNIVHYKTFMSYASPSLNIGNQFDLPAKYLNRSGKHINQSLNIKEVILPERRRANIRDAETVMRALPPLDFLHLVLQNFKEILRTLGSKRFAEFKERSDYVINIGFAVMQNVLQDDFIDVWEQMNLSNCVSGSFELYKIIRNSFDTNRKETWLSAVSLRLEEKLIASKRALHNLERVHEAYNNGDPLLNGTVTPEGRYDSLYFTSALFPQTAEINQTYIQLREQIHKYIQNIEALVRIYNADGQRRQARIQCFNYSDAFLEASVRYERYLRTYESLVVRKPLERILAERKLISNVEKRDVTLRNNFVENKYFFETLTSKAFKYYVEIKETHITDTIEVYLGKLKAKRLVSKLDVARELTSDRITQLLNNCIHIVPKIQNSIHDINKDCLRYIISTCKVVRLISNSTLLRSFVAKMSAHYNNTKAPEKAHGDRHFIYRRMNSSTLAELGNECMSHFESRVRFSQSLQLTTLLKELSLRNLTSFKNRLESFIEMTRLDGKLFR